MSSKSFNETSRKIIEGVVVEHTGHCFAHDANFYYSIIQKDNGQEVEVQKTDTYIGSIGQRVRAELTYITYFDAASTANQIPFVGNVEIVSPLSVSALAKRAIGFVQQKLGR